MIKLRLFSVFMGMVQILLLYALGRAVFGSTAGLVAAACLALSPTHTYYAQEVRMYVAFNLFALLSALTLWWTWQRGGRARWFLHGLCQACLMLTHPFALLVPFSQGVFLLVCHLRDWRRVALWTAVTGMAFVPTALVLLNTSYWGADEVGWLPLPSRSLLFGVIFSSDSTMMGAPSWGYPTFWQWVGSWAPSFGELWATQRRFTYGRALMWLSAALAAVAVTVAGFRLLRRSADAAPTVAAKWSVGFLLWWILPAMTLFIASHVWRPCMAPRYTMHSSMGLYLLIGAGVALLPGRALKALVSCVLIALYAFQQSLVAGPPKRTDYQSAADHILAHSDPRDVILVHNGLWKRVFAYILEPIPKPL